MKVLKIIALFFFQAAFCQVNDNLETPAKQQAQELLDASVHEDPKTILKYTHPKIVKKYGKKKLRDLIEEIFATMDAENINIEESRVTEVSEIIKEQGEYRCLVKNQITMNFSNQKVKVKTSMIGFYNDTLKQWSFVESVKLKKDPETKILFSDFETSFKIPEDEQVIEE